MHLLLGNSCMEARDYEGAIRSFERARAQMRTHASRALLVISLVSSLTAMFQRIAMTYSPGQISGWRLDDFDTTIRQRLCEALYAAGRIKEAGESLLNIVNTVGEDVCMTGPIVTWVPGKSCYPVSPLSPDTSPQISCNDASPPQKAVTQRRSWGSGRN